VTAYREEACGFCELASLGRCPRCQVSVCAAHGPQAEAFCALCAKELKDDLDVASFSVDVHDVPPDSGGLFRGGFLRGRSPYALLDDFFDSLVSAFQGRFRRRRVRRVFDARSPAEIAAWRRQAGVRVRGQS
jgi:hypothetical protein